MLKFNFQRILKARGIEKPYSYLVQEGFSRNIAVRMNTGKMKTMDLQGLEKLCERFECTPNDLLEWVPERYVTDTEKHQAQQALLYFKSAEKLLLQASDHLNIMLTPFKDNPDMTPEDVMKARPVIRRFRDKAIDNFNEFKKIAFQCINLMQIFESDTQTQKLMKSFISCLFKSISTNCINTSGVEDPISFFNSSNPSTFRTACS